MDTLGRETVTWVRTFATGKQRRFDAYMIWSDERGCIVNYLGTHQHLAVDLELRVADNGGLQIRSTELDDLRKIVLGLTEQGVHVQFEKENLTFTGKDSPMSHLLLSVMGAFAQFERDLIRER